MTVNIQSKSCGSMSQVPLHRFDIISVLEGQYCEYMPLRYNNGKPEKPHNSNGFKAFSLFSMTKET